LNERVLLAAPPSNLFPLSSMHDITILTALVGVLESKLDSEMQASDFEKYVDSADFSSPKDRALFWMHFEGEEGSEIVARYVCMCGS